MPLFVSTRDGVQTTPEWDMIRDQLAGVPDLKLVVLDPLSTFAQVDLDADNCAVGFVAGKLGSLASDLHATVIATHHMRKHRANETPKTPAQARELIRGASNIVDGCASPMRSGRQTIAMARTSANGCAPIHARPGRQGRRGQGQRQSGSLDSGYIRTDEACCLIGRPTFGPPGLSLRSMGTFGAVGRASGIEIIGFFGPKGRFKRLKL